MDDLQQSLPDNIIKTMQTLQSELKKIEDLNGIANKYRDVASSMIIALDSMLKDEKDYRKNYREFQDTADSTIRSIKVSLEESLQSLKAMDMDLLSQRESIRTLLAEFRSGMDDQRSYFDGKISSAEQDTRRFERAILDRCKAASSNVQSIKDTMSENQKAIGQLITCSTRKVKTWIIWAYVISSIVILTLTCLFVFLHPFTH